MICVNTERVTGKGKEAKETTRKKINNKGNEEKDGFQL